MSTAERIERRLTAILAADVVGYSRLMSADEEGTLAQLKGHRSAIFNPSQRTICGTLETRGGHSSYKY